MNLLYRQTFMDTWVDVCAAGMTTVDARELAEITAREAVEKMSENARDLQEASFASVEDF